MAEMSEVQLPEEDLQTCSKGKKAYHSPLHIQADHKSSFQITVEVASDKEQSDQAKSEDGREESKKHSHHSSSPEGEDSPIRQEVDAEVGQHVEDNLPQLDKAQDKEPKDEEVQEEEQELIPGEEKIAEVVQPAEEQKEQPVEENKAEPANFNLNKLEAMSGMLTDDLDIDDMDDESEQSQSDKSKSQKNIVPNTPQVKAFESLGVRLGNMGDRPNLNPDDKFDFNSIEEVNFTKTKSQFIKLKAFEEIPTNILHQMGQKRVSDILQKLLKERHDLMFQLQATKEELATVNKNSHLLELDMSDFKPQFVFLFASPLVREIQGSIASVMQIDCLSEVEDILDSLRSLEYSLKYRINVANRENFRNTVIDGPIALHFSGHGVENNQKSLGQNYFLNQNRGNLLLLENSDGKTEYYFEDELTNLVSGRESKFEVVFISSCHSEFAGKIFLNAGAKHVICIRQSEKISDAASLKFSCVFYQTLFGKRLNV